MAATGNTAHRRVDLAYSTFTARRYLRATIEKSRVFSDYFNLSSYFVPRVYIPPLPPHIRKVRRPHCAPSASHPMGSRTPRGSSLVSNVGLFAVAGTRLWPPESQRSRAVSPDVAPHVRPTRPDFAISVESI